MNGSSWVLASTYATLCYKQNSDPKGTSLERVLSGTLSQTLDLANSATRRSSTSSRSKVRTLSVIKPTVVGRPKLTMLAAVDGRPMSLVVQFIRVSVHLSVYSTCEMQLVARLHLRQLIVVIFFADNVGIGREFESSCAAT